MEENIQIIALAMIALIAGFMFTSMLIDYRIKGEGPVYIKESEIEYAPALAHKIEAGVIVVTGEGALDNVPYGDINKLLEVEE